MAIKSRAELYAIYKASVQGQDTEGEKLTDWSDGSINDMLANAVCLVTSELQSTIVEEFNRTFISNAAGADKDELVTDHFGPEFDRPEASKARGIVKFSRPDASFGAYVIPEGTSLESAEDANGETQLYVTLADVSLGASDLFVYASVEAVEAGLAGNIALGTLTSIVDSLDDETIVVTNEAAITGGYEEFEDSEYQNWIGEKISAARGGSAAAIEAACLLVDGIEKAKAHESFVLVQEVLPGGGGEPTVVGSAFSIVLAKVYIADANGTANSALLDLAEEAVNSQRAYGVNIQVLAATPFTLNWEAELTLNIAGPNYATLSASLDQIKATMRAYIDSLAIGADFDPVIADAAMMAIWGPSGTDDITAFETVVPVSSVATGSTVKLIPGTITL